MKPLDNVKIIEVKDGVVTIIYKDGTKFTTKDDITLVCFYKDKYGVEWMSSYPYYPFKFRKKTKGKWTT
jgi:hypothetical protein